MRWLMAAFAVCSCSLVTNLDDLRAPDAANDADAGDAGDAATGPSFVQQNANDFNATPSASISFASPVRPHDTIVVCVRFDSSSSFGTLAVTDTTGDSFHIDVGPTDTGMRHYIFSANDVAGGSPNINLVVTGPPPVGVMAVYILEYSGVTAFATGIGGGGTAADISSGTQPVTQPSSLVLGFIADDSAPVTPDPAFNVRSTFEHVVVEDEIALAPGPRAATATTDAGTNWAALMAIYSP